MTHTNGATRTLSVASLARVEGEGSMHVIVRDGVVRDVELRIFEPPRFFEAFLRGRAYAEVPDITARICGICPVAYQMSACQAIESACGVTVGDEVRALRRLLYCGEWIESHALHIYLLHAPDFLGYESSVALAQDHRAIVERGLKLKKVGNDILNVLGGRAIHPVNVRVGGFYKAPSSAELGGLAERLHWARDAAIETVRWVAGFDFPDLHLQGDLVAMRHEHEYPITQGRIASTSGLDITVDEFPEHFSEEHVAHSTALHGRMRGGGTYTVGPLARYNLNFDRLPAFVQQLAAEVGLGPECRNPFQSIIVRALEVVFACDEALRIIEAYEPPATPYTEMPARAGTGHGCTEAPRGLLYHRYTVDEAGVIRDAVIVPPTSQNQPSIERGLRDFVQPRLHLDDAELTRQCEQAIRNYDPCISCATHFLDLTVDRGVSAPAVVIGIGNRFRRDDGSALKVLEELAGRVPASADLIESDGEPTRVIDSWDGMDLAVIVETVRRGDAPGTVAGLEWDVQQPSAFRSRQEHGSHSLGLLEAVELGRAVERMPLRLRLVSIEPLELGWGEGLSEPVARSIDDAARLVLDYLRSATIG